MTDYLIEKGANLIIPDVATEPDKIIKLMKKLKDAGYSIVITMVYAPKAQCEKNGAGKQTNGLYNLAKARDTGEGKKYSSNAYELALGHAATVFDQAKNPENVWVGNTFMIIDNSDFLLTPEQKITPSATSVGVSWNTLTQKVTFMSSGKKMSKISGGLVAAGAAKVTATVAGALKDATFKIMNRKKPESGLGSVIVTGAHDGDCKKAQ